jgi:hypothetical protein
MASAIFTQPDPTKEALLALANEFELRAAALQAHTEAALKIGYGDDIRPADEPEPEAGPTHGRVN